MSLIDEAIREWSGPAVPSLERLRDLAAEVEALEAEREAIKAAGALAVADGGEVDTGRLAEIDALVEARESAVPVLQGRMVEEHRQALEAELVALDSQRAELRQALPELEAAFKAADREARRARAALARAQRKAHSCSLDVASLRGELRRLEN